MCTHTGTDLVPAEAVLAHGGVPSNSVSVRRVAAKYSSPTLLVSQRCRDVLSSPPTRQRVLRLGLSADGVEAYGVGESAFGAVVGVVDVAEDSYRFFFVGYGGVVARDIDDFPGADC